MTQSRTLEKLNDDFEGALPFAGRFFDTWVFVHNSRDGRLPAWLVLDLQARRVAHPELRIETFGYEEMLREVLALDQGALVDLLGPFPSQTDFLSLRFEDLRPILTHIATVAVPADIAVRPVPTAKLEYNRLGDDARQLLLAGMRKAALVRSYLDRQPDKDLAARVSGAFHRMYEDYKQTSSDPDTIFHRLQVAVQGPFTQQSKQIVAALAVLAYLFEECDIFERPPET
jgi:hypothetical protein